MKIKQVDKATVYYVETDEKDWHYYIRHSADSWCLLMGESWETQNDCEELEKEFQKYIIAHNKAFTETKEQKA